MNKYLRLSKKTKRDILLKALAVGFWLGIMFGVAWNLVEARETHIDPTEVSKDGIIQNIMSHKTLTPEKPTLEDYRAYVKTIFGSQWKIAFAVSQSECNYSRREWPYCVNSWAKERSVGPFQINIAQNDGKGAKIHWDKIPGETLKDKELWLADWKNNVVMAYRIYRESGWQAWTAYTSKSYLQQLKKI